MPLAVAEFLLIAAIFVADEAGLIPVTKTPVLLGVAWMSLRLRGKRWRDVGLVRPESWPRAIAIGTVAGLAIELLALFVTEPLFARLAGADPGLEEFRPLVGNLRLTLLLILVSWVIAACGEEAFYRGYLMHRTAAVAGGTRGAWMLALVITSVVFGWAHGVGQGITGALQEGFAGLLLGLLCLAAGRRLPVPIIAHGVSNTLAFALIYLGKYPGV